MTHAVPGGDDERITYNKSVPYLKIAIVPSFGKSKTLDSTKTSA